MRLRCKFRINCNNKDDCSCSLKVLSFKKFGTFSSSLPVVTCDTSTYLVISIICIQFSFPKDMNNIFEKT
ncbi:unnamed protein product [Moneuplotes crassus]|uniref:Uncharacterized protein n=1 Tax=Euplotes crassus TaxID=5936 RepID=A0AAD1U367_EUPCR|nr:unnamed protein product [Moneuplotes crassus]